VSRGLQGAADPARRGQRTVLKVNKMRGDRSAVAFLVKSSLMFPNRFDMSAIMCNFAIKDGEITPSRQKNKNFLCFALDFS